MNLYLWLKAAHIVSVIAWMAGMLYLPRLFVYHAGVAPGSPQSETFKVMERRLLRYIMLPAMIATWVFGLWLVYETTAWRAGWFHTKFALVIVLSGLHGYLSGCAKRFAADSNTHPQKFYRIVNEIPTVLMIAIVILAVVKPF